MRHGHTLEFSPRAGCISICTTDYLQNQGIILASKKGIFRNDLKKKKKFYSQLDYRVEVEFPDLMWLDCWASAFLSSGFMRFLIQWATIWIIHFARFFRSHQRWKQCWHVNGIAQNGYSFSLASVAGMPTSQRWLNPGIRLVSVVNSPWEICEMLEITKEPSGFIFTSLTWPGLAPESPFPGRKLNLFFFNFEQSWVSRASIPERAATGRGLLMETFCFSFTNQFLVQVFREQTVLL